MEINSYHFARQKSETRQPAVHVKTKKQQRDDDCLGGGWPNSQGKAISGLVNCWVGINGCTLLLA